MRARGGWPKRASWRSPHECSASSCPPVKGGGERVFRERGVCFSEKPNPPFACGSRPPSQGVKRQAMSLLHTIVAFIVALGLLIVVHEYGHYLIARWCGVKVLRFSVGFGRPLLTKEIGPDRTEWVIAAIPFGGYVKMLDEREGAVEPRELERSFNRQSVWRRFGIVVAG